MSRSLRGNVDRNPLKYDIIDVPFRRSLRGNVDRNDNCVNLGSDVISRSLRGNVDRNIDNADDIAAYQVVPYVGTWIEIDDNSSCVGIPMSFPTWERG